MNILNPYRFTGGPIGYINSTTSYNASTTSNIASVPSGTLDGHVMIAFLNINNEGQTINTPSGWTKFYDIQSMVDPLVTVTVACFYRVASSEPSTYTFDGWSSARNRVDILTYENVNTSTPLGNYDVVDDNAGGITVPSITISSDDSLLLYTLYLDDSVTIVTVTTPPTGMTQRVDGDNLANGIWVWDEAIDSGASGSRSTTHSNGANYVASLVEVKP